MGNLSGLVITVYDSFTKKETIKTAYSGFNLDDITFEPVRFPRHWYRHLRYGNVTVFTSELNPPEIGADSAMEMGLEE